MNPEIHIKAQTIRASRETEDVFNYEFWEDLDVVISDVDNIDARLYLDEMCVYYMIPLLEAGTSGALCSTQTVIPCETESYGASQDPIAKQPSRSTLESFPYHINHCLTWARSDFEWFFEKVPQEVNSYLRNSGYLYDRLKAKDAEQRKKVEGVLASIDTDKCSDIHDCILWARRRFEDYFVKRVERLTRSYPEDDMIYIGAPRPFWSAPRRFPHPVRFSTEDPSHIQFIMAASILRAETFGKSVPEWVLCPQRLAEAINKMTSIVPPCLVDDFVAVSIKGLKDVEVARKLERCRLELSEGFNMHVIGFAKGGDNNCHIDFISSLANLRAKNYGIPEIDRLSAKIVIERIIPGNATCKALAASFACLELYNILDGLHVRSEYRNAFVNMGTPLFTMAEPLPPKTYVNRLESWNMWQRKRPEFKKKPTLRDLLKWLHIKDLAVSRISHRGFCIYQSFYNQIFHQGGQWENVEMMPSWEANRFNRRLDAIIGLPHFHLDVECTNLEEEDDDTDREEVECMPMPMLSFYLPDD